jgi:Fuc2NAc and GlcNAc transferase
MLFAVFALTFLVAGLLTPLLTTWAHRNDLLDIPNARSSHVVATPRIGGVALVVSVLAGLTALQAFGPGVGRDAMIVVAGASAIAALGLVDDFRPLPALTRLLVHVAVAISVVIAVQAPALAGNGASSTLAPYLMVVWIVGLTNAYNFMDGIDGIAGIQALIAGLGWTALALLASAPDIAVLAVAVAGASAGFLLHNWHPAKVFMGDTGSGFLGFLFASIPLLLRRGHPSLLWGAVLLMWPFLFDTGFTLIRRVSRSENLLSAHRSHLYQRLVLTGRSHRYVTLLYGGLAILGALAAVAMSVRTVIVPVASMIVLVVAGGALWWNVASREAAGKHQPPNGAVL